MGRGHTHTLYVHEHSILHRLPPEVKIVATVAMVVSVAVTPRESVWAFACYVLGVALLTVVGRVPRRFLLTRLAAVAPFIAFALFLPFIAAGETTTMLMVEVSVPGLWAAWNVAAKAILGASLSILLTATTEVPEILAGLGWLRVPAVLTSIAVFMIRYLEVVSAELGRMRMAMTARGFAPGWVHQAGPIGHAAGALFVRSYERGERVHSAMLARGFTGVMPRRRQATPTAGDWVVAGAAALVFVVVAVSALVSR